MQPALLHDLQQALPHVRGVDSAEDVLRRPAVKDQ